MRLRFAVIILIAVGILAAAALRADPGGEPGSCPSDSKLLNGGPTSVFGEGPGTFWGLIIHGLIAAGFDQEAEQVAYLNQMFGTASIISLGWKRSTFNWSPTSGTRTRMGISVRISSAEPRRTLTIRSSISPTSALATTRPERTRLPVRFSAPASKQKR